jgi:hypothetical protein
MLPLALNGVVAKHCTPARAHARIAPMFLQFFVNLRQAQAPVTPREYLGPYARA